MIKRTISAVLLASIVLLSMAAFAGAQYQPGADQGQYGGDQGQQGQYGGQGQLPGGAQAGTSQLNIPPAPQKIQPNPQFGNTDRSSIIGQKMSKSSGGNAVVTVDENANNTISLNVDLQRSGNPTRLAPTLANLTYMVGDIYSVTDRADNNIYLNVYDTSKNQIMQAMFSPTKNAFEYFNVPEAARQAPPEGQQPQYGGRQPGYGGQQPGYGGQQPGYGGRQQPSYGGQQPGYM